MPVSQYVGHVSLSFFEGPNCFEESMAAVLSFCSAMSLKVFTFVFERGTENAHPHAHFYVETVKAKQTVVNNLRRFFNDRGQAQFYSLKLADPSKLDSFFVYLAKGLYGKVEDEVKVLAEDAPRMWGALHQQYHQKAEEIKSRKKTGQKENWYLKFAEQLRGCGSTSKEDVMQAVTRFYVYESAKGFDRFAVVRTFWAVWSLVSAADAHACLLESCTRMIEP